MNQVKVVQDMDQTNADLIKEEEIKETEVASNTSAKEEIDFSGKDFAQTQKLLNINAQKNTMLHELGNVKKQKNQLLNSTFQAPRTVTMGDDGFNDPDAVIQYHLDQYTFDALNKYLGGDLSSKKYQERIDKFFTNPDTGEVLGLLDNPNINDELSEYDFKRGMLLYFKQNDEYMENIDQEIQKLNEATEEITQNINEALNPLRDNIYAYAQYLEDHNQPEEGDDTQTKKKKEINRKRAKAIRSGFTLENMVELIQKHPSMKSNALSDFKKDNRLKEIGARYASKLKGAKINFNLFPLLADDVKENLEYRVLPIDDYPAGLEGFTVFFIIRSLSMSLPNPIDEVFHASVQLVFRQLLDGTLDSEIADMVRGNIKKFLALFAE